MFFAGAAVPSPGSAAPRSPGQAEPPAAADNSLEHDSLGGPLTTTGNAPGVRVTHRPGSRRQQLAWMTQQRVTSDDSSARKGRSRGWCKDRVAGRKGTESKHATPVGGSRQQFVRVTRQ